MRKLDVVGTRYGRFTIVEELAPLPAARGTTRYGRARCDCGNFRSVRLYSLRNGSTKSCGCYHRDRSKREPGARKHGLSDRPEYYAWYDMTLQR